MERMQKSMNTFIKWSSRTCDAAEDKERGTPLASLGRSMAVQGENLEADSELGNCLVAMGRANERIAGIQEHFVEDASSTWWEHLERSVAMMKEYSVCVPAPRPTLAHSPDC